VRQGKRNFSDDLRRLSTDCSITATSIGRDETLDAAARAGALHDDLLSALNASSLGDGRS